MADLDSRSKRASSVGLLLPCILSPVLPDATLDQGDRQHVAWSYSGILAGAAAVLSEVFGKRRYLVPAHKRHFTVPPHQRTFTVPPRKRNV